MQEEDIIARINPSGMYLHLSIQEKDIVKHVNAKWHVLTF
jgi:hypothetical protein